jgi:signal transduction histidine kinase
MMQKDEIVASLKTAQSELEHALVALSHLPSFDLNRIRYAAHTLNNYLTVAEATIALLEMHLSRSPNEDVTNWLNGLKHATALMTQISLELLNIAPVEKAALRPEKVDLVTLVGRACDFYRSAAGRKQIALRVESEVESPFVWADRVALAVVLDNLLSNAIKFSQPGTEVRVRVYSDPNGIVCAVHDQGPGLTPEDQVRLFQRGVRLSNIPTAGEPSTGFGLAVAKDLVDGIGGEIWCESSPGQGSTFSFRVPVYSEQPQG